MKPADVVVVHLVLLSLWLPMILSICISKEREGLLKFKGRLRDPFSMLGSWAGQNCCRWDGVTCDHFTGHVIKLNLPNNHRSESMGLEGEIDPSLCNLEHLQLLNLSNNNFNSTIPKFIDCFQKLTYLNLASSNFYGEIPSQLGNLSNLQTLDLSWGNLQIANTEPFGRLSSLHYLDISYNYLVDSTGFFHSLNRLSFISEIYCKFCVIELLPQSLLHLNFTRLTKLVLLENKFNVTIPPWLFQIKNLEYLDLSGGFIDFLTDRIIQPFPVAVGNLYKLRFLGLSSLGFSGAVPSISIERLSRLEELYMCCNFLSGPIPHFNGLFPALRVLDLSLNQFNGSIPESLGSLPMLQNIYLQSNRLSGFIPQSLCGLSSIRILELSMNEDMEGTIPDCLWQQSGMEVLGFGGKGLEGVISEAQLSKFRNLAYLTISSSKSSLVVNISEDWTPPFNLTSLIMTSCNVGPHFPLWIETQKNLLRLNLSNSGISGSLPVWIWDFSFDLRLMDLSHNNIDGEVPTPDKTTLHSNLCYINLSSNRLQGSMLWFFQFSWMQYLDISKNNLSGEISSSICEILYLPDVLDISENNFSGEIPVCLQKIQYLNLAKNNLTGTLKVADNFSCHLVSLHLEKNDMSGVILPNLRNCSDMVVLDLGENKFVGDIPAWLSESMPELTILRLRSNIFSGTIPHQLSSLNSLQILDLANNDISGMIPHSFGNFTTMREGPVLRDFFSGSGSYTSDLYVWQITTITIPNYEENVVSIFMKGTDRSFTKELRLLRRIDLSQNELFGEIPEEIGDLLYLNHLILSDNNLTGSVPDTISNLRLLEELDLSNNSLSGVIPQDMSKLTYLDSLNLSYNNLSGRIPTGAQFSTFTDLSFIGNPHLCGSPLQSCEADENQNTTLARGNVAEYYSYDLLGVYLGLVLGFVIGFWTFYGTLFFNRSWRYKYFGFLSDIYMEILGRRR